MLLNVSKFSNDSLSVVVASQVRICSPVTSTCHHSRLNKLKLKHEIVVIRTTKEGQGSVSEAAAETTLSFADLSSSATLVTESRADIIEIVTDSLQFAALMSTVAAVTGFGACVVGTVAFWTSDTRKENKNIVR